MMPLVVDHYHYNLHHLDHHAHLHLSILGLGPIGGIGDAALARSGASAPVSDQLLTKKFTSATAEAESASKYGGGSIGPAADKEIYISISIWLFNSIKFFK